MKQIGQGLQYKVYDLENGRVLKIATSTLDKILILIQWGNWNPFVIQRDVRAANKIIDRSIKGLQSISGIDWKLLGNPTFKESWNYEQDKIVTLGDYFRNHSLEENEKIIDAWIENIFELWKFGISDTIFNFTFNNGVDREGKVILSDIGELTFDKFEVAKHIQDCKWLTQRSLNHLSNRKLKVYITQRLTQELTIENLEKYWIKG